jgi:alkylation response protein AidB-like acyl-CoA dehydrogenase
LGMFRGSVYLILDMFTKGIDITPRTTALKANGSRLAESIASRCIELHGGNGTVVETGITGGKHHADKNDRTV